MNIKTTQFCSLATSAAWQTWLYDFDEELYVEFITQLRQSKGCNDNSRIMMNILNSIRKQDGLDDLYDFLSVEYPHVLKKPVQAVSSDNPVFKEFVPGILTYPHREILVDTRERIQSTVSEFLQDKSIHDYIIIDGVAYIEYLDKGEEHLQSQIPKSNWQVETYKRSNKIKQKISDDGPWRIHVIYDVPNWAYYHVATALQRYAPPEFVVTIGDYQPTPGELRGVDLVLLMPYVYANPIADMMAKYCPKAVLVGDVNVGWQHRREAVDRMLRRVDAVVHNNWESFEKRNATKPKYHYQISNGVDLNIFKVTVPWNQRPRRLLWVGSEWHKTLKGYEILEELRPKLESDGIEVDLKLTDSQNPTLNHADMAKWYNTGAVYVIASESEGTPNPGLESSACGCALVSTQVGNMPELISNGWNGVLLSDRQPETILRGIKQAFTHGEEYSRNMQATIAQWGWEIRAARYFDLFGRMVRGEFPDREWSRRFNVDAIKSASEGLLFI